MVWIVSISSLACITRSERTLDGSPQTSLTHVKRALRCDSFGLTAANRALQSGFPLLNGRFLPNASADFAPAAYDWCCPFGGRHPVRMVFERMLCLGWDRSSGWSRRSLQGQDLRAAPPQVGLEPSLTNAARCRKEHKTPKGVVQRLSESDRQIHLCSKIPAPLEYHSLPDSPTISGKLIRL